MKTVFDDFTKTTEKHTNRNLVFFFLTDSEHFKLLSGF